MKVPHLSESPFACRGVTVEGQRRDGGVQLRHEELQERRKGTGSAGAAAAPEGSRAGSGDEVKMAEEGLVVAEELRSLRPEQATVQSWGMF